jgi:presequence protease
MTQFSDPNNAGLRAGDEICGYRIQRIAVLKEIGAVFYHLEHMSTAARHVHISNQDQENTFGVTFKTVPTDSTGVAHILEHTVLCGSRNFPVRDPFFSMLKRSLSTFMNAFTASDWTMYPFSTQNRKDFYNLMDVYLDAAFFPNLDRLSFKQEGHRLEIEGRGGDAHLVYKGVVYNEMKGAMSSPDQVMGRSLLNALYPDTTYSNNSGGDPAVIPRLTHEQLIAFHRRHYHPSNAYFYTYGNLPLKDHLAFIAEKTMRHYKRIDPQTDVPAQVRWNAPRTARYAYPFSSGEDFSRKSQVSLAWLTSDIRDTFEVLVLTVLEQILLGNAASPLRKALMDSGLGSALSDGTGYEADNRDTLFTCGLKDAAEDSADAIERIILDTLGDSVQKGLDAESIASAIHQIEFHRKEVTNTPYPYGLKLLLMIIGSWLHGGDPERILQLDADFTRLRAEIAAGPFLEGRIKRYFLDNSHRVRLCLAPDPQLAEAEEARVRAELDDHWRRMDDARRRLIEAEAAQLQQRQESSEEISCLPTLALADIPPQVPIYAPTDIAAEPPLWRYALPTSGIYYLSAAAGAADLPEELLPWVPFFCYTLAKIGTSRYDYAQMARRIDAATGGIGLNVQARVPYDPRHGCLPLLQFNAKCLARNIDPMVAIVEELIAGADFNDLKRLRQLMGEYRSGLETMIVQNGHRLAISSSSRNFSTAGALSEMWSGIQQVRTIRNFSNGLDDAGLRATADRLTAIAKAVFTPQNMIMSAIGEVDAIESATHRTHASRILSSFRRPRGDVRFQTLELAPEGVRPQEGWSTSSSVAFVARTLPAVSLGHPDAAGLSVLAKLLRSLYLHREIREKGGAYGGFAIYNPEYGLFSLASYRDPHIVRTLKVYEGALDFLKTAPVGDEDIKEAVLQVCSEIDKPDPPGPAARKAFLRQIVGLTDEARTAHKQQLLAITRAEVMKTAETYLADLPKRSAAVVIAGQTHLEAANAQLGAQALTLQPI